MTILEYITPSRLGGAEEYFLRLCEDLRARGHRVLVVTKRDTPLRARVEERLLPLGVELFAWRTNGKFDLKTYGKLRALIRREKVDIVHTHLTTASWMGALAARSCRVPGVAHVHGMDKKTWFQHADYQIAVADAVKKYLVEQGIASKNIVRLYVGLPLENVSIEMATARQKLGLELPHDARLVGVVASLIERKGHRFLLDAMSQIDNAQLPDNSQLHAVFAGEGVLRAELEAQVRVLDLQQRVHFLGFRDDAKTIMAACDIVALPSLKEGLSIAAMEAMWLRRAVVATAIAGMPELVVDGETGLLVPPADAASLARALEKLLNDDTLRARLADNGHDWLQQHFDEKKCFAQTEKFLLNVISTWRDGKRVNCDFLG